MTQRAVNLGSPVNRAAPLNRGLLFWLRRLGNQTARRNVSLVGSYSAEFGASHTLGGMQWGSQGIRGGGVQSDFGTQFSGKITTALTIAAVITPKSLSGYSEILACNNNAGTYPFGLRTTPTGKAECYGTSHGGSTLTTGTTTLTAGRTYHLCCTIGSVNGVKLYVDGVQDATNSYSGVSMDSAAVPVTMLAFLSGTYPNDGLLSDLRIYTRELMSTDARWLCLAARTGYQRELNYVDTDVIYGVTAAATFKSAWTRNANTIIQPLVTG